MNERRRHDDPLPGQAPSWPERLGRLSLLLLLRLVELVVDSWPA